MYRFRAIDDRFNWKMWLRNGPVQSNKYETKSDTMWVKTHSYRIEMNRLKNSTSMKLNCVESHQWKITCGCVRDNEHERRDRCLIFTNNFFSRFFIHDSGGYEQVHVIDTFGKYVLVLLCVVVVFFILLFFSHKVWVCVWCYFIFPLYASIDI